MVKHITSRAIAIEGKQKSPFFMQRKTGASSFRANGHTPPENGCPLHTQKCSEHMQITVSIPTLSCEQRSCEHALYGNGGCDGISPNFPLISPCARRTVTVSIVAHLQAFVNRNSRKKQKSKANRAIAYRQPGLPYRLFLRLVAHQGVQHGRRIRAADDALR